MNPTWSTLGPLAAVAASWAAIWWLRKRELNFSLIALLALGIGVPIGLVAGGEVDVLDPIGRIYINVLLATVAPLILVAIVSSITSLGTLAKLRSIGLRSVFWLLLSNALGVIVALGLGLALQPGSGVDRQLGTLSTDAIQGQVQKFSDVVVGFFPTNLAENFSANDVIPIILIAVTLSVAFLALAEKEPVKARPFATGAEALKLVVFKAVGYVIRLTPYAIVALTAHMVGTSTDLGGDFRSLVGLLALVWGACLIHTYVLNGALLAGVARVPVVPFFRKIFPAQLTAFSTQSSVGSLPVTTAQLTRKVGVHPEIAHFTAPLGTTIGMPGCAGIWPILIAVWGINAYGLSYSVGDYVLLAALGIVVSIGVAGVPGAATVSAATVLSAAGLPLEFVAATIPIGVIADMARTATNVTAAAVSATVVARQTGMLDEDVFAGRTAFVDDDELVESDTLADAARPRPYAAPSGDAPAPAPAPAFAAATGPGWAAAAPVHAGSPVHAASPGHAAAPTAAFAPAPTFAAAASSTPAAPPTATYGAAPTPVAPAVPGGFAPTADGPVPAGAAAAHPPAPRVFWGATELSPVAGRGAPAAAEREPTPA